MLSSITKTTSREICLNTRVPSCPSLPSNPAATKLLSSPATATADPSMAEGGRGRGCGRGKGERGDTSNNWQQEQMNSGMGAGGGSRHSSALDIRGHPHRGISRVNSVANFRSNHGGHATAMVRPSTAADTRASKGAAFGPQQQSGRELVVEQEQREDSAEKETRCGSEATVQPRLDVLHKCYLLQFWRSWAPQRQVHQAKGVFHLQDDQSQS